MLSTVVGRCWSPATECSDGHLLLLIDGGCRVLIVVHGWSWALVAMVVVVASGVVAPERLVVVVG